MWPFPFLVLLELKIFNLRTSDGKFVDIVHRQDNLQPLVKVYELNI